MNEYMKLAIEEAEKGIRNGEGGPFGSVIVKNGKVIGRGHNEVVKQNDPTCHGEIMAIRDACKNIGSFNLEGADIYTTGQPCPMCLGAILWANINHVYYGCSIEDTEKIGFDDAKFYELSTEDKMKEYENVLNREECLVLYDEYVKSKNKVEY